MSQPEDTELRDLVIEALEKNGTLPNIRAQLRANIFNVFETDHDIKNANSNVINRIFSDNDSCLSFFIIYEFLEFCGLKNTLFVYKSESGQGKGYVYEGRQKLIDQLTFKLLPNMKDEPILVQIIKTLLKNNSDNKDTTNSYKRYTLDHGDERITYGDEEVPPLITFDTPEKNIESNYKKDDENCTYIVHDDTASYGSCTHSQSDHSPDRHKLQLKLHLEHSETDTSSTESNQDKSSSDEYIPSENIPPGLILNESHTRGFCTQSFPNEILMQTPISLSLVNGSLLKTDEDHPNSVSVDEKYASRSNISTSYMHINLEPKVRQESVIKRVSSNNNGSDTSTPTKKGQSNETKRSNSHSDNNTTDNITSLLDSSNVTPDKVSLKSNTDSPLTTSTLSKSLDKFVRSKDSEINIHFTLPTEKSGPKQGTDLSRSSMNNSNIFSAKPGSDRTSINSEIASQEYTIDFYTESQRSEGKSVESLTGRSETKSDSDSIQEDINFTNNNSDIQESPRDFNLSSSVSLSDVAELIESSRMDSPVEDISSSQKKTNSNHSSIPQVENSISQFNGKNLTSVDSPFKGLPSNKNITVRSGSSLNENEKSKFSENHIDLESPLKYFPSNKNITVRSSTKLNEHEKGKFSTVINDEETYSDSFSKTISNVPTENMEWNSNNSI